MWFSSYAAPQYIQKHSLGHYLNRLYSLGKLGPFDQCVENMFQRSSPLSSPLQASLFPATRLTIDLYVREQPLR